MVIEEDKKDVPWETLTTDTRLVSSIRLEFVVNKKLKVVDMYKCYQDICCLEKCHHNSWYLLKIVPGSKPLKFGQNRVINSWDIPDMDKCCQDKCCLDKCHCDSSHLLKIVPETYLKSLVKFGSVTAEIFLIWTNVSWTNANLMFGICSRCSKEAIFKVLSKLGQ